MEEHSQQSVSSEGERDVNVRLTDCDLVLRGRGLGRDSGVVEKQLKLLLDVGVPTCRGTGKEPLVSALSSPQKMERSKKGSHLFAALLKLSLILKARREQ